MGRMTFLPLSHCIGRSWRTHVAALLEPLGSGDGSDNDNGDEVWRYLCPTSTRAVPRPLLPLI